MPVEQFTPPPDATTAFPPAARSAPALPPIAGDVYRWIVLDMHQTADFGAEPTAEELADAAALYVRLERLQRAADAGHEILDPLFLPWLEHGHRCLCECRKDAERGTVDESDEVARIGGLIVACEGLIERLGDAVEAHDGRP